MYETALPANTLTQLLALGTADIVVGIPSYRNADTIQQVTAAVASALRGYFPGARGLIVNVDGLAFDETLALAQTVPMPPGVTQVASRYNGLPGKGSAVRAILESASAVQARALAIIEADARSFTPEVLAALLRPVLDQSANFVLPDYAGINPPSLSNEVVGGPLLRGLYDVHMRHPLPGDVALAGGVAAYFADRDVWETEVARDGIDGWMLLEMIVSGGRVDTVALPAKVHRPYNSLDGLDLKFVQEVGVLFRTGLLHERVWHKRERQPQAAARSGVKEREPAPAFPDPSLLFREGQRGLGAVEPLTRIALYPQTRQGLASALSREPTARIDALLWAHIVYDFFVLYNLGEGDPDKVLAALYPLALLRGATLAEEAAGSPARWEALLTEHDQAFRDRFPYLVHRWDTYVPPEMHG